MTLKTLRTGIVGVAVVDSTPFEDRRGKFSRVFCEQELAAVLGSRRIVQINHSLTRAVGAIRGLHYQRSPNCEMKLVRCIRGRIADVAVDLRIGSPTFLKWHSEELSPENARMLIVPEGCAHGFQVLEENTEVLYFVTAAYSSGSEGGIRYDDPRIGVAWPMPATDLSVKDLGWAPITPDFAGISV